MLRHSETNSTTQIDDSILVDYDEEQEMIFPCFKSTMLKTTLFNASLITVILQIVAMSSVGWVNTGSGETGIFLYCNKGSENVFKTTCNSSMSQTTCGYISSSQISAVASVIFAGVGTILLGYQTRNVSINSTLVSVFSIFFQTVFSIITLVVFSYFTHSYLESDDGMNIEYPTNTSSDRLYAFYVWLATIILSFIIFSLIVVQINVSSSKDSST